MLTKRNSAIILAVVVIIFISSFLIIQPKGVDANDVSNLRILKGGAIATPQENITISGYIMAKKNAVNERIISEPENNVLATVSFAKWLSIDELNNLVETTGLKPISVIYSFRGKNLGQGQMILKQDDNLKIVWQKVMNNSLDNLLWESSRNTGLTNSPDSEQQLQRLKEQDAKKIDQIRNGTSMIYAVRINASIKDLAKLNDYSEVRLIDIATKSQSQYLAENNVPETKAVFPAIIPDDTDSFTGIPKEI